MELAQQVDLWRQKAREGTLSLEEMREAITALRAGRQSASTGKVVSKRAATEAAIGSITFEDI